MIMLQTSAFAWNDRKSDDCHVKMSHVDSQTLEMQQNKTNVSVCGLLALHL